MMSEFEVESWISELCRMVELHGILRPTLESGAMRYPLYGCTGRIRRLDYAGAELDVAITNISSMGVGFECAMPLELNEHLTLRFSDDRGASSREWNVVVVWLNRTEAGATAVGVKRLGLRRA